jgi:protein-tyrosine kinase
VQAEKTLQSQVRHALTTIEACPVKMLVLNQARGGDQAAYGYGYGYGYGQESSSDKKRAKKEAAAS